MKRIYERLDLYFALFYCFFSAYIKYLQTTYLCYYVSNETVPELMFSIFYIVVIIFDIWILIVSNKKSSKKTLLSMLIMNLFFSLAEFLVVTPIGFLEELTNKNSFTFTKLFFEQFYFQVNSAFMFYFVRGAFVIISVLNILMLIPNPPKMIDKKK